MRKTAAALIIALLITATAGTLLVNLTIANPMAFLPYITVKSNGTIEPQTGFIRQDGNVYTLTSDLVRNYAIKIQSSNIVFDGAAHTINGSFETGYGYSNIGLSAEGVTNITVKDVEVKGFMNMDVSAVGTTKSVFLRVRTQDFNLENGNSNMIAESNISLVLFPNNNTFIKNNLELIEMYPDASNIFFENNFWKQQYFSVSKGNFWDNGSVGNYWSWYRGVDANGDGIGDTPHIIIGVTWDDQLKKDVQIVKGQDNYPLMNPWNPTKPFDTFPPRISVGSPENKVYNESSIPLVFSILEPSSLMSYSLNGKANVTITGNTTLNDLPNGSYNLMVYVTDRSGNVGASEISYFTVDVPELFPIVPVAAVSAVLIIAVAAGLLLYKRKRRKKVIVNN